MLIDVNASHGGRESTQHFTLELLDEELSRTPATHVLVGSHLGSFDQQAANQDLLQVCQSRAGWMPAATIQPRDTFVWEAEIDRMVAAGSRVFRLDPQESGFPVDSVFLDLVFEKLTGSGSVAMLPATQPGLPSTVAEISSRHGVPVIFTEARYFPLTEILPLMKRHESLYVETSRLTSPGGIARVVEQVGADRVVYGSGACRYPAWIAWRMLESAPITVAQREAIAFGNAARLIGLDARERESDRRARSSVRPESARGESDSPPPPPPPAIDIHLHDRFPGGPFPPFAHAEYAAVLRENGVAAGVSSSATAIFRDLERGNDQQFAQLESIPILRGYVVIDPRYPEQSAIELTRLEHDDRWVGVKVHCAHAQTTTNSAAMSRVVALAAEYGRPMLVHPLGSDWPEALCALARSRPEITFIAAHGGYGDAPHPTHDAVYRIAGEPNIVTEFCSTYLVRGAIRRGIEAMGIDRVLFGSDFPLISLPYMRTAYQEAELSESEAESIAWKNALRVFPALSAVTEGRLAAAF